MRRIFLANGRKLLLGSAIALIVLAAIITSFIVWCSVTTLFAAGLFASILEPTQYYITYAQVTVRAEVFNGIGDPQKSLHLELVSLLAVLIFILIAYWWGLYSLHQMSKLTEPSQAKPLSVKFEPPFGNVISFEAERAKRRPPESGEKKLNK